jgi:putative spermidine/putrescine transport system substrate-binding protein/spermidine/putrescine transport system substrate-binding protein
MKRLAMAMALAVALAALLALSGCKPAEPAAMSLMAFAGYAEDAWVKPFEEANKCTVKINYAGTVEEMFNKVKSAPNEYNIVSIDPGRIGWYRDAGLLQPIDVKKLSNYSKMGAFFREHPYNKMLGGGVSYHVPIVWGTQTITVNTAKVAKAKLDKYVDWDKKTISYDIFTAPEFKGQTAFFDESTNVTCCAAMALGVEDPFKLSEADFQNVAELLYKWKKNARTFTTGLDSEFAVLTAEDAFFVLGGNDALLNIKLQEAGVRQNFTQFVPDPGTICWIDGWVITEPTKGKSLELAYKYIDMMIGDQVQKQLANLVGYGIVNPAGQEGFSDVIKDSCYWYLDIAKFPDKLAVMVPEEDTARRVNLWTDVKARP